MPGRRRHVDPLRVHLITLVIFGVLAGCALALWTFPRFFATIALLVVSGMVYARLYTFLSQRLEAEEGRLAQELGFELGDDEEDEEPLPPKPRKARKKKAAPDGNGAPAPTETAASSAAVPSEPPPS